MSEQWLECVACHAQFDLGPMFDGCPKCAGFGRRLPIEVRYKYAPDLLEQDATAPGIWRWRALLPAISAANVISLEEGNTPLLRLNRWKGAASLYLKNETINPTWAWKDRSASVSISASREFGFAHVAAVSTGNHGVSTAAYSAAAGQDCVIFCHEDAPEMLMDLMELYDARVFRGGRREEMLRRLVAHGDWFPSWISCPRAGCANPFGIEGFKIIAFEVFHQLGKTVPDRVFVPAGSGDGAYGVWKGFQELQRMGVADRVPRMYICQAAGADPYARSFRKGLTCVEPLESAKTIALSICEKIGGDHALQMLYESNGDALSVTDDELLETVRALAREGLALEPAAAAPVACLQTLADGCGEGETWVAIGTGAAVKWPETITSRFRAPEKLEPDFEAVEELFPILSLTPR